MSSCLLHSFLSPNRVTSGLFPGAWTDQSGTWEPQVRPSKAELKAWPLDQGYAELMWQTQGPGKPCF